VGGKVLVLLNIKSGPGSSVGIAIDYGLDGPGIESRWGRDFGLVMTGPWGLRSHLYNGYWVFPGGKVRPGRAADHSPPSNADVLEE
jgi:8-oxo-dGTP pyrophosphatase MutT (NUDIX family)